MTPLTLSLRQRKLVHYLQLQSAYTTGQELASQLQVSARTIRNDIAEINQILIAPESVSLPSEAKVTFLCPATRTS